MSMITDCNFCMNFTKCPKGRAEMLIEQYPYEKCPDKREMPKVSYELRKALVRHHPSLVEEN